MRDQEEAAARASARLAHVLGLEPERVGNPPADADDSRPPSSGTFRDWARHADLLTDPSRRGSVALVAVAVVAVLVALVLVWRARPEPVDAPPVAEPVATSARAGTPTLLLVDVQGLVRRPGIVRLPAGARVADAIAAAGGLRPGASTQGLNLARRLTDGEQVLVGVPAPAGGGAAPGATGGKLDLNLATAEQLEQLPGVGPVLAARILAWRDQHGRFASVDQLREVKGIGARTFEELSPLVYV